MKRYHTRSMLCLLSALLAGLLLAGSVAPSKADSKVSAQALRDFALPIPLFAATSAWNQPAATAAVWPGSNQQILVTYRVLRGDTTTLHPPGPPPTTWPFMWVNYDEYTMPIFRAGAGQANVLICDYEGNMWWPSPKFPSHQQQGGPVSVPPPAGTVRPASPTGTDSDGHLVLYHPGTFTAYDYWQATTVRTGQCQSQGGGLPGSTIWEAGVVDFFDVRGTGANPDTYYSARATGVPLLAGLLLPEDVESGAISHALAVAIPGLRNLSPDPYEPLASDYFYPASTTETDYYNTNEYSLAAGQRIRLKQSLVDENGDLIDEDQLAPITRMFLAALRTYGAYVVDNAGGLTFYAEDIHSANLHLSAAEVNALVSRPAGTPLPRSQTNWHRQASAWQTVMEQLNLDLEDIPFAYGPWPPPGNDPANATIHTANFEVVAPATTVPVTPTAYLPLILNDYAIDKRGSSMVERTIPYGNNGLRSTSVLTFTTVATTYLPLVLNAGSGGPDPMPLSSVKYWAYQLQGISEPGAVDALVNSHYDMLVLEPTRTDWSSDDKDFDTKGMVARLKNSLASDGVHRKLVIAYIDIGEAEDWRWYWTWSQDWDCMGDPPGDWPDYILACDPDGWAGNYPVAYWDPRWKDVIIYGQNTGSHQDRDYTSAIDEAIVDGFDGIYLDWVEGYEDPNVVAAAQAAGKDPAVEMIAFIQEMRTYAAARNPNFLIIQQNAAALCDGHPELFTRIDAIAQEAIWYDGDADVDWGDPAGYDSVNDPSLTSYYVGYLDLYLGAGLPVFNCEYALSHANTAYANSLNRGYVPYATRRSLSRLTTTPPPGY